MERWIIEALISTVFAGLAGVIAKQGLADISGELGMIVRTGFVAALVCLFALLSVQRADLERLKATHVIWLGLSGAATVLSWTYYFKALKHGQLSTVALIDKGSFVVATLLAWLLLGEQVTWRAIVGMLLIVAGIVVVSNRS